MKRTTTNRACLHHGWTACRLLICGLALTSRVLAGEELPATNSVTPELYATGFAFAEGPAFDVQGNLYVVNYRELGMIGRITPDGTASIWCDLNKASPVEGRKVQANGLKIDGEGRLIAADAGGGRLLRIAADGRQVEVLADRFEGTRFNSLNDVALDQAGNIFFTDPGASSSENPVGAVYRYDIGTKKTTRLAEGLAYPNGIGVAPGQQYLCVGESDRYRLLIFDLDAAAGSVSNQRVLIDFPQDTQGDVLGGKFAPDGFVFDTSGRLYVAMWVGGVVNVVDVPSGTLVRQYSAGGGQATNCHFHGPYLYTTVAAKEAVFRLKLGVQCHEYWVLPDKSAKDGAVAEAEKGP
ncbi:MAG: SMP-30/gluconolactonase/LRE family protein [Pirellulaceae bacterium]|nr:SMP-30/gluconolactonase/LRE family protein [Pirellulaceae bacterium]